MKVVVTALGESPESPVDQRFGRARFFLLFDQDRGQWSVHANERGPGAEQGAGIRAAGRVVELGARVVITGHCGPQALAALSAAGVGVYQEASGCVWNALAAYEAGVLRASGRADAESACGGDA